MVQHPPVSGGSSFCIGEHGHPNHTFQLLVPSQARKCAVTCVTLLLTRYERTPSLHPARRLGCLVRTTRSREWGEECRMRTGPRQLHGEDASSPCEKHSRFHRSHGESAQRTNDEPGCWNNIQNHPRLDCRPLKPSTTSQPVAACAHRPNHTRARAHDHPCPLSLHTAGRYTRPALGPQRRTGSESPSSSGSSAAATAAAVVRMALADASRAPLLCISPPLNAKRTGWNFSRAAAQGGTSAELARLAPAARTSRSATNCCRPKEQRPPRARGVNRAVSSSSLCGTQVALASRVAKKAGRRRRVAVHWRCRSKELWEGETERHPRIQKCPGSSMVYVY